MLPHFNRCKYQYLLCIDIILNLRKDYGKIEVISYKLCRHGLIRPSKEDQQLNANRQKT